MNYFKVTFFKLGKEENKDSGEMEKTGKDECLGSVVVDDYGCDKNLTLASKAWRQAPSVNLIADKIIIERI